MEPLNRSEILSRISPRLPEMDVRIYDSLPSTSSTARELLSQRPCAPALIAAAEQTAGRGTKGRRFFSLPGGAYFTLVLPDFSAGKYLTRLTPAAAVAAAKALEELTSRPAGIKWVNDVLLDGKKMCGILTEATFSGSVGGVLVGIGANLYPPEGGFPAEIASLACAACPEGGMFLREKFIAAFLNEFLPLADNLENNLFFDDYVSRLIMLHRPVFICRDNEKIPAEATGITEDYALCVHYADGREDVLTGDEISIINE